MALDPEKVYQSIELQRSVSREIYSDDPITARLLESRANKTVHDFLVSGKKLTYNFRNRPSQNNKTSTKTVSAYEQWAGSEE